MYGLTSHSTHSRSFRRRVFPGNRLHWYWQPKTIKHNTTYTRNTKEKQKKTVLANKTVCILILYGFYDLWSGNGVGPILTALEPTRSMCLSVCVFVTLTRRDDTATVLVEYFSSLVPTSGFVGGEIKFVTVYNRLKPGVRISRQKIQSSNQNVTKQPFTLYAFRISHQAVMCHILNCLLNWRIYYYSVIGSANTCLCCV